MKPITDKEDNTSGSTGNLPAPEYNDHKNEIQKAVESSGQILTDAKTPDQNGRAMFIYGSSAQSVQDSSVTADTILLSPLTGSSGLIAPDDYSQMNGMIVSFNKVNSNTSSAVIVNFGQTGTELGAKSLVRFDDTAVGIGEIHGYTQIIFDFILDKWKLIPQAYNSLDIGYTYWQLPGEPTPSDFYHFGTWSNISSSFAGDFFRVEGGDALSFNGGQQLDAFQGHHISLDTRTPATAGASTHFAFSTSSETLINQDLFNKNGLFITDGVSGTPRTAVETRSINQTIRIWKLTAKGL